MRIRAVSVFEGIVYHCHLVDGSHPCRPTLEVDAIARPGDVDQGPLLLPVADYLTLAPVDARPCLDELDQRGRIEARMGVRYVVFPTWSPVGDLRPPGGGGDGPDGPVSPRPG